MLHCLSPFKMLKCIQCSVYFYQYGKRCLHRLQTFSKLLCVTSACLRSPHPLFYVFPWFTPCRAKLPGHTTKGSPWSRSWTCLSKSAALAVRLLTTSLVQFSSVSESCLTLWDSMDCRTPGLPVHHQLPEFTQTHSCCCQWCHPTISSSAVPFFSCLQSVLHQGLFKWVNSSHQWPKYWSFSFSINPSNEYSGLISFTMDWLDLLAVQETLKSLLQHHSSKASILQCSAFFIVLTLISIHDYWEKP